jgi:hypothetical protein
MVTGKVMRGALAGVALLFGMGLATPAHAGFARREANATKCSGGKTLVRIDDKTCPATKHRLPLVLHRACCSNKHGKLMCKPFGGCPQRSPS